MGRRVTWCGVVAGLVVLAAGCAPPGDAPVPAPTSATPVSPGPETPSALPVPASGQVRDAGAPLAGATSAGHGAGALLPADGATLQVQDATDGTTLTTVTGRAGTLAWVAPPEGGQAGLQSDGSVTLQDAAGTVVAALTAPVGDDGAPGAWRSQGDVLALEAATSSASFVVGTAAVSSATWGDADGGRSLLVVPADWVRGGTLAAQQALVSQLALAEPEAASPSMQAQLWCHVLGARDKASWNLEPWRPEVSTTTLLMTRCNPTDDDA
ncbi:DUF2599 domain-containing protein [Cellulomonas dongxiuzhuiae]|uniref:DUF2599 domain-containing protein n=1 Tax=Cellulomonas dongxiuzhuiae TaxID=2819979 RepID=UPI0020369CD4|nr:DUF2599 domain-containing protein [Cellulomonas dongxiuzhuiae]